MGQIRTNILAAAIAGASLLSTCGSGGTATASTDTLPTLSDISEETTPSVDAADKPEAELTEAGQNRLLAEYQARMADFSVDDGIMSTYSDGQSIDADSIEDDEQLPDLEKLKGASSASSHSPPPQNDRGHMKHHRLRTIPKPRRPQPLELS